MLKKLQTVENKSQTVKCAVNCRTICIQYCGGLRTVYAEETSLIYA